jgi:hypothetical protein
LSLSGLFHASKGGREEAGDKTLVESILLYSTLLYSILLYYTTIVYIEVYIYIYIYIYMYRDNIDNYIDTSIYQRGGGPVPGWRKSPLLAGANRVTASVGAQRAGAWCSLS